MSLSFLPLPLLVILVIISAIWMFVIARKAHINTQRLLPIGYSLIGIGAIGGGLIRVNNDTNLFANTTWLGLLVFICTGSGILIALFGKYQIIKDDPLQKEIFIKILIGLLVFIIIMSLFLSFIYLKMKGVI